MHCAVIAAQSAHEALRYERYYLAYNGYDARGRPVLDSAAFSGAASKPLPRHSRYPSVTPVRWHAVISVNPHEYLCFSLGGPAAMVGAARHIDVPASHNAIAWTASGSTRDCLHRNVARRLDHQDTIRFVDTTVGWYWRRRDNRRGGADHWCGPPRRYRPGGKSARG
jgi:hypothetical protein